MAKAKTMNRSRNQLATAYAPESFFTFEGGLGACISHSTIGEPIQLSDATIDQIFERINELGRAWFSTAMSARDGAPDKPPVMPKQCVDAGLLDNTFSDFQSPGHDRIHLCRPSHMGYTPAPLSFVCRTCGLFKDYESLNKLDKDLSKLTEKHCQNPKIKGNCDWEQLDVIFVHWSGHWEAAFPGQYHWSDRDEKVVKRRDICVCGSNLFRLNRRSAGIGDWFFECASCDKPLSTNKWLQNDPVTLRILGPQNRQDLLTHARMQATPYRASSAYYVKSDLFIDFKDSNQELLLRLRPGREEELKDFVAKNYGFNIQPITDDDVELACAGKAECATELAEYRSAVNMIQTTELQMNGLDDNARSLIKGLLEQAYNNRNRILEDLRRRAILIPKLDLPVNVINRIQQRQLMFASKFDPFRLGIEHATLKSTRLDVETRIFGKKPYVSFTRLDEDLAPEDRDQTEVQQTLTQDYLNKLGLEDMGLIREFDLCRFSFGYSRMESTPILRDKRGMDMPVRLNLFPPVKIDSTKYPVYVVQQGNEALYVRLKEDIVSQWLMELDCPDMFALNDGENIGAGILGCSQPMGPFLDKLPESDTPPVYFYIYSLLHSYSHLLMKHISEYSGLDLGSLGEYIFPADLAFVVYRNGTTMDLGNLSALWRNSGTAMLAAMLNPKATQCGTGSLCTHRGGACPDCIMMPETSCIASNKLLSRSVLRSIGGRPRFDSRKGSIRGYLDFVKS